VEKCILAINDFFQCRRENSVQNSLEIEEWKFLDDVVKALGVLSGHVFKMIIRVVNLGLSVFSEEHIPDLA
jgi:hypothetical protein